MFNKYLKGLICISVLFVIAITILIAYRNWSDTYANSVPVLMYHNVIDSDSMKKYAEEPYADIFITIEKFEKQMKFLKDNNYKTLTLDELYQFIQGSKKLPARSVLITFDDGRKNVYVNAYPILKKYNMKAVIFLITSKNTAQTEDYIPMGMQYLSKEEIEKGKDVFEYASHTHNMHKREKGTNKPYLAVKSKEEIKKDIKESLQYTEKLYFAYPYGSYKNVDTSIFKELGIKAAFITKKGKVYKGDSIYKLKRNGVSETTSEQTFKKILGYKN